jgi:hypothetical protein
METEKAVRKEIAALIEKGHAHLAFEDVVRDFSAPLRGRRPKGLPYSGWELLEHIRIAQRDILEFTRDAEYQSPSWPEGYWPATPAPPDEQAWEKSVKSFLADRRAMLRLLADPARDLTKRIAHGSGQSLLREALLVADHTAYHLGQMIVVRRLLGDWEGA